MKTIVTLGAALGIIASRVLAAPVDEEKPYGRVCIAVADASGKEDAFRSSDAPAAGKKINVYLDASTKCTALVAALRKDGKLAYNWKPQVADLEDEFEEAQVPKAPVTWEWIAAGEPFEFYVVFLPSGAKETEELKKLASAMQSATDERLLSMQTNKFRELLSRVAAEKDRAAQVVTEDPEVGGVFRGSAFPWRQFARAVNFAPDHPGVIIVPSAKNAGGS